MRLDVVLRVIKSGRFKVHHPADEQKAAPRLRSCCSQQLSTCCISACTELKKNLHEQLFLSDGKYDENNKTSVKIQEGVRRASIYSKHITHSDVNTILRIAGGCLLQ